MSSPCNDFAGGGGAPLPAGASRAAPPGRCELQPAAWCRTSPPWLPGLSPCWESRCPGGELSADGRGGGTVAMTTDSLFYIELDFFVYFSLGETITVYKPPSVFPKRTPCRRRGRWVQEALSWWLLGLVSPSPVIYIYISIYLSLVQLDAL